MLFTTVVNAPSHKETYFLDLDIPQSVLEALPPLLNYDDG